MNRDANVLGALALVLADRMSAAFHQSPTGAAALSALDQFLDGCSVDRLRRVLGLTPSGTVRLVDRLQAAGLVRRGAGGDARTRSLTLTAAGTRAARRITAARAAVLEDALSALAPDERRTFDGLVAKMLDGVVRAKLGEPRATPWTCRLCDLESCGRDEGTCPAANAARNWGR